MAFESDSFDMEALKKELEGFLVDEPSEKFDNLREDLTVKLSELEYIEDNGPAIILLFRDTCGYCKSFKPAFAQLYEKIKAWNETQEKAKYTAEKGYKSKTPITVYRKINVFLIDTDVRDTEGSVDSRITKFMRKYGVQGVPTMLMVKYGGTVVKYDKERDPNLIFQTLLENVKSIEKVYGGSIGQADTQKKAVTRGNY